MRNTGYYLGIDNGSSSVKAALYNDAGELCSLAKREIQTDNPAPGYFERDMDTLWKANCDAVSEVLEKSGIRPEQIAAVTGCGHGKGLYLWGKNGSLYPGILSSDTRALPYVQKWKKDGTETIVFQRTGQHILPCHPAALLCWFRDHRPEILSQLRHVFTCKDYIRYRLTGQACCEITECCGMGYMNMNTLQYDEELLRVFGLEKYRACLPPIFRPADLCGTVSREAAGATGLLEGTPVAAGLFDIGASSIATDAIESENICMIAGTWSINEYIRRTPIMDGSVLMNSVFCEPGSYLIEESSPTSATNNQWYVSRLVESAAAARRRPDGKEEGQSAPLFRETDRWVEEVSEDVSGPLFLPFVAGSNVHPKAQGAFVGLQPFHDIRHLSRSVYEGITFGHRQHLERLLAHHPSEVREIHLAGGAANSAVWRQMFADVCGFPVRTSSVSETGTLGCAIIGTVAAGRYPDIRTAISHMVHLSDVLYPDEKKQQLYNRRYQLYQKTVQALDGLWDELSEK